MANHNRGVRVGRRRNNPRCKLAYATFGKLNAARKRHPDSHLVLRHQQDGHLEQIYTGKGRRARPDKYFIIIVNQIGSGCIHVAAQHASPGAWAIFAACASVITFEHRHKLVPKVRMMSLALVVGGSDGAQQTTNGPCAIRTWSSAPRRSRYCENTEHDFLFTETGRCDHVRPRLQRWLLRFVGDVRQGLLRHARCGPSWAGARNSSNKTAIVRWGSRHSTISSSIS